MKSFHRLASIIGLIILALTLSAAAYQKSDDGGYIVDAPDPGYTEGGTWTDVCTWDLVGQSYTSVRQTIEDNVWAKWTAKLDAAGKYRVLFWHVPCSDISAKVEITHDGKTETQTRNVAFGHLGWTSLGDYDFAAGEEASVKITHGTAKLLVDSVKFIRVSDIKPLPQLPPYPKPDGSFPHFDAAGNLIISGQPYQSIYQELHEETTAHPEEIESNLDETFDMALNQGVNTLGTMIYWRNFEKTPGDYDYAMLDALIDRARVRHMHVSLILFFAWRNLQSYYLPQYITKDHEKYLFDHLADGKEDPHRKVSPFADATREAETKALTALFQRVLKDDPDHQVVSMAQLENEMPAPRDYSAPGLAAWNGPVPQALTDSLAANESSINRLVWRAWNKHGKKRSGTWAEVFGDENVAYRIFGAWSAGSYMQALGTELKKVLPIPYYMNAWVGESPSTYTYMDVFHAAAPVIDAMGPDAYGTFATWESNVALSQRPWNHLVIPEQEHTADALWRATANYNAIVSGQWHEVEGFDWLDCRETCDLFEAMAPLIGPRRGTGQMFGFYQSTHNAGESWSEYWNDLKLTYTATVANHLLAGRHKTPTTRTTISNIHLGELDGCGMLMQLDHSQYVLTSTRLDVAVSYINGGSITVGDAQVGHFENGNWVTDGPATVEQSGDAVRFHCPTENRKYVQIRFTIDSSASNPAQVFEAERGKLIGGAEPTYNATASGAFQVNGQRDAGNGIEIATNMPNACNGLTIRYAGQGKSKATVQINDEAAQEIEFPPSGSRQVPTIDAHGKPIMKTEVFWASKSIPCTMPAGPTIKIMSEKFAAPDLDCILLSRDALPTTEPAK